MPVLPREPKRWGLLLRGLVLQMKPTRILVHNRLDCRHFHLEGRGIRATCNSRPSEKCTRVAAAEEDDVEEEAEGEVSASAASSSMNAAKRLALLSFCVASRWVTGSLAKVTLRGLGRPGSRNPSSSVTTPKSVRFPYGTMAVPELACAKKAGLPPGLAPLSLSKHFLAM